MNDRLKYLMLQAGYAAPELAGRAKKLSQLLVLECVSFVLADVQSQEEYEEKKSEVLEYFGLNDVV